MLKALFVLVLVAAIPFGVIALATVTSSDGAAHQRIDVNVSAILELASSAEADAERMEDHATAMLRAAFSGQDVAGWTAEAQTVRANAQSLRFLAASARAIHHDLQTFPVTSAAVDLGRLLGNGRNLEAFGKSILAHAEAMDAHIGTMRRQVGGDGASLAAVDTLASDVSALRSNGEKAVHQGQELANRALTAARGVGIELE